MYKQLFIWNTNSEPLSYNKWCSNIYRRETSITHTVQLNHQVTATPLRYSTVKHRGTDTPSRYSQIYEVHLHLSTCELYLHLRGISTPVRYIYTCEAHLHLRDIRTSTTMRYICNKKVHLQLRLTSTPFWNSWQIRPQKVRKYDANTNTADWIVGGKLWSILTSGLRPI